MLPPSPTGLVAVADASFDLSLSEYRTGAFILFAFTAALAALIQDASHLSIAFEAAVTVVHAGTLLIARARAHPGFELYLGFVPPVCCRVLSTDSQRLGFEPHPVGPVVADLEALQLTLLQRGHMKTFCGVKERRHATSKLCQMCRPGDRMRQLHGVTRQRLENQLQGAQAASRESQPRLDALRAANEQLRETDPCLQAVIADECPSVEVLSQSFPNADDAVQRAEQLRPSAADSSDETAQQGCGFKSRLGEVVSSHDALAAHLNQAVQALQRAEQNCAAAATTAAQHLAQQDAEFAAAKAEADTLRESLERQLAEAESALGEAVRRSADDRSAAIQLAAQRKSEFEAVLSEEVAKYDTLAQDLLATRNELAHADARLQEAETRHALALTAAAAQRHEQEARHAAQMAEAAATRDAVSRQLHEVTAALDRAQQDYLADATAAADRLVQQEVTLREGTAAHQMLEGQLADAHTALQTAEQRAAAEGLAARQRAAERDAEFVARLDQEAATRETLEQALTVARNKVAEAETAIRNAESRHAAHITTVTARFADQQVQYEIRLAEAAAARDLVDQRQRELEVSFERSREERAADAAAAAERVARLEAQRVEALANLQMLEGKVADANAALHVAEQHAATERLTAERQAAQRQAELEAEIARETAGRHAVEQDLATLHQKLAERESALRSAEQRHASAMTSAEARFVERHTELETRLSHAAAAHAAHEQALLDAEQRYAAEMKTAASQIAERHREVETLSAQIAAVKEASDLRLR